jgi:hypothetical protein
MKLRLRPAMLAAATALVAPTFAQADLLSLWIAGKGTYLAGNGDVFQTFGNQAGGGVEVGLHVLFLDVWADLYAMPDSQLFFTVNAGPSFSFGDDLKLTLGAYASFLTFVFPEVAKGSNQLQFSADDRSAIAAAGYADDIAGIEASYNANADDLNDLERTAFGIAARARASVEYYFVPLLAVGVEGIVGYHYLLSGEEAASGAKNEAITKTAKQRNLPDEVTDIVRKAVGAKEVDKDNLTGLHYQAGLYLKLKFGL